MSKEFIFLSSPSANPGIRRHGVQHLSKTFGIGADCCSCLQWICIAISAVDVRSPLVLVLESRIFGVDGELYAISEEFQRVTDVSRVLQCRPHAGCRTSRERWSFAESGEQLVPESCFLDDGDAEVALFHRRGDKSALRAGSIADDEKPAACHGSIVTRGHTRKERSSSSLAVIGVYELPSSRPTRRLTLQAVRVS